MSHAVEVSAPPSRATLLVVAGTGLYGLLLFETMNRWTYDIWGAVLIAPLLVVVSLPIVRVVSRSSPAWLPQLLVIALVAKLLGSIVRYWTVFSLYDGVADARRYHDVATHLAPMYRHGDFTGGLGTTQFVGTGALVVATTIVYTLTTPTLLGGFFVFAWLAWCGQVMFFCAFRRAFPGGHLERYAVLVLLLPSMLFWPSSIGKESLMTFFGGLAALGAAMMFAGRARGLALFAIGLAGEALIRPHVAALMVAGVVAGYAVRRPRRRTSVTPLIRVTVLGLLLVGTIVVVYRAASFLGVQDLSPDSVQSSLSAAGSRTSEGGSAFAARPVHSVTDVPHAVLTVLFRPFPWEAHNAQTLVSALEGVLLLVLAARWNESLRSLIGPRLRDPYVVLSLTFVLGFTIAFSSFGNFGILVRERVQILPFIVALLCLPDRWPSRLTVPDREEVAA